MTEQTQLQPYEIDKAAELKKLGDDYRNLVVTRENLKEADKARLTLKNARLAIQKIEKANNDILNKMKKKNSEQAAGLLQHIEPVEIRLQNEISGIEAEIELERRREEDRKKALQVAISNLVTAITDAVKATATGLDMMLKTFKPTPEQLADAELGKRFEDLYMTLQSVAHARRMQLEIEEEKRRLEEIRKEEEETRGAVIYPASPDAIQKNVPPLTEAAPGAGVFEPMLRPMPNTLEVKESEPQAPYISKSMGVNTRPQHHIQHMCFDFYASPNLPVQVWERICHQIVEVLDTAEDLI